MPPPPSSRLSQPRLFPRAQDPQGPQALLVGTRSARFSDLYHVALSASWTLTLLGVTAAFLSVNGLFALAFLEVGGVANARPGSFTDAFFFSVQTFATIGYGQLYPQSVGANLLVTLDSLIGMVGVALATGLVFAKFSRPKARIIFSNVATLNLRNGQLHFMFRVANERTTHVVEARLRLAVVANERTAEGETLRRMTDLTLVRNESPAFILTWTAMHRVDETSPFYQATQASLEARQLEVLVLFSGVDGTLHQTLHARHSYLPHEIRWGERLADMLSTDAEGRRVVDYRRFHETVPQ